MCEGPHNSAGQGLPHAAYRNNVRTVTRCVPGSAAAAHSRPFALLTICEKRLAWHDRLAGVMGCMVRQVPLIGIVA
jgi:hypothetical protein